MTTPSYSQSPNTGIAFDQSAYLERIATALETMAANSTAIKNSLTSIDTNITTQTVNLTSIKNNLNTLTTLAQGTGIHMIGPYEWVGISSMIKVFQQTNQDLVALKNYVEASVPRTF